VIRRILIAVGFLALAVLTLGIVILVGMRTKAPPLLNTIRRFNRAYLNPRQLETAGQPGAYASLVRHAGRVSGASYRTPVIAMPDGDSFLIALPYGTESDWLKNVLAHGSATIVHEGVEYPVDQPEIVPVRSVEGVLPADEARTLRLFGVDTCLRLHQVPDRPDQPPAAS
jgi:deazaflavin-dependent oxidoreductase (nitroreductase family)